MNRRFSFTVVVLCFALSVAEQASAYYAAHMGRFTSRDPAGEIGRLQMEMPPDSRTEFQFVLRDEFAPMAQYNDGLNLYQYVQSVPTMNYDPTGGQGHMRRCGGTWINGLSQGCCGGTPYNKGSSCCENGQTVDKVPIWVCDVPLGSDDGTIIGPAYHSYIVCEDPVKNPKTCEKYGFHPLPFGPDGGWDGEWDQGGFQSVGPGYVNREDKRDPNHPNASCFKRMVCPSEKKAKCKTGVWKPTVPGYRWQDRYHMCGPGMSCQEWAHETQSDFN
jgi:hypothetical protein